MGHVSTTGVDVEGAFERFEASRDFTAGIEEEFALLEPGTLDLVQRFEELRDAARAAGVLDDSLVGELISSEIEIRSGCGDDFTAAAARQLGYREQLFKLAREQGVRLVALGTHPWAAWQDQHIIDTPHYHRVEHELQYVAWRNNTFSVHIHVGMRGADRAVAVCDSLRNVLPTFLALSASSAYLDGRFAGLHSARSQIFTRSFPRCGIPDAFGSWRAYADHVRLLVKTNSVVEATQLWWSVRPHHKFGTVEIRICDAQSRGDESLALAALMYATVVQAARDYDEGCLQEPLPNRLLEENFWRAIRYGLDGKLIDFGEVREIEARAAVEELLDWTAPARASHGLDVYVEPLDDVLANGNGAQRQWRLHESGASAREVLQAIVADTQSTYVAEEVSA